ncbi:MAG TPA: hypothetical protein ENH37_14740, partial [Deltaproteobacteria bacterium]|nr:hypothetical protein [Deltaproteobacteria bacterium]
MGHTRTDRRQTADPGGVRPKAQGVQAELCNERPEPGIQHPVSRNQQSLKGEIEMLPNYYQFYCPVKILSGQLAVSNIPFEMGLM